MKTQVKPVICILVAMLWLLVDSLVESTVAQDAGQGGLDVANVEGTLVAVSLDRIQFKTEDDQEHIAVLNPKSTLTYTGTADSKFLQKGLYVRFTGSFNTQQGTLVEPLAELQIFIPVSSRRMTVEQRQAQTPGIYPVIKEGRGARRPAAKTATTDPQEFRVVGRIGAAETDRIQILAGNRPMLIELAPEVKITVTAGDATFCRPGDKIAVAGLQNPQQENWLAAETIEIEGAEPLTIKTQQPAKKRSRPERGKSGDRK